MLGLSREYIRNRKGEFPAGAKASLRRGLCRGGRGGGGGGAVRGGGGGGEQESQGAMNPC